MSPKLYKAMLAMVAVALMFGVSLAQRELSFQRKALDLDRFTELKGAPPVLALTTVALGGFRGLISNLLWMRANDLQENDKYFEMVQLADWITKLEPHFTQVWLFESWNMAYNISVKFKDPQDRWRWVQRGIELLRDEGLQYNPHDVLIHRELAGFFQHKMGANMDDAHFYYKKMWALEMAAVLGRGRPNWDELINPKTEEAKKRVEVLKEKFKLDPELMKRVDEQYGPLEWKLPETHAIYWAVKGLDEAKNNERQIDPKDLITLRRMIYQSMQLAFQRGRLIIGKTEGGYVVREFAPNLEIIPQVSAAYEQAMNEDEKNRDHIQTAHRNMVRDAVFYLYTYNRQADAIRWYKYLAEKYPDKALLEGLPGSLPRNLTLDQYAIGRIAGEVDSLGHDKAMTILEGLERTGFEALAIDDDDRYIGMHALAEKVWNIYRDKIGANKETVDKATLGRVGIPPLQQIRQEVLKRLLNGELLPDLAAQLRTKLGLAADAFKTPAEAPVAPANGATTNAPSASVPPVQ